ncbi:HAD family hydrolase [Enterococcus sp. JM4C]|uniref:HAD family hydrolase n=1 Tax=Candidatus Enterococcus huntleyi TaxID=1857217 RepID=UPI0013797EA7|nr:HAD family phosphatase [Enterococcus sp. JM4C]KAF1296151.1 HAD family hydrolase [Enterococcus sp. JM4C]
MTKVNGVIFDMDGLIFETEMVYYEASQKIADALGMPFSLETYTQFIGISDAELEERYHQHFADFGKETIEKFIADSYSETSRLFKSGAAKLKPGVRELIDFLEENNIPRVVASSNNRPTIELLLEQVGLRDKFTAIVSAEDVTRAKPDPEIFCVACETLGTRKEETLVLEDSRYGVLAAEAAGIPVIMVPDLVPATAELNEKTVDIVDSLFDVLAYLQK